MAAAHLQRPIATLIRNTRKMIVSEIMRRSLSTVRPETGVIEAADLLLKTNQRALPVVDDAGLMIGIVSEGDFLHRSELGLACPNRARYDALFGPGETALHFTKLNARAVNQLMSESIVSVDEDSTVDEAVALMDAHDVSQIPVVCAGYAVGMITRLELVAAVARIAKEKIDRSINSQLIPADLLKALDRQSWSNGCRLKISAVDKTVLVSGSIKDERQRAAIIAFVQSWPGVQKVMDHIAY